MSEAAVYLPGVKKVFLIKTWKKGVWLGNLQRGRRALCLMGSEMNCQDCPYITCNNHPRFYMALQCALRMYEESKDTDAKTA